MAGGSAETIFPPQFNSRSKATKQSCNVSRSTKVTSLKSKIRLFDGGGTQIGPSNIPDTGNNLWDQVVFGPGNGVGITGVRKIDVNFAGSGALDNITYNVVPVTASVWLFGNALIGFIGYSRRTSV